MIFETLRLHSVTWGIFKVWRHI